MGMTPATAVTWEATTYASAFTTGTIADTTPNATEVSHASSTPQVIGAGYRSISGESPWW